MHRAIALAATLLALSGETTFSQGAEPEVAYAQYSGSAQEQAACRPDARRFCRNVGTDQTRVLACLQDHRARLSRACRLLLERNGQ
jgi:Cysteine rich repeat